MIIKTKSHDITVSSVVSTTINRNGKNYPALKFNFDGAVSADDLTALISGEFEIGGNTHEGYNTLGEIAVTVGKITTAEQERNAFEAELTEVKGAVNTILPVLDDKTALSVKALFPSWEIGKAYATDERFLYNGELYKVVQDHTSQADWTPDGVASLYEVINATNAGTLDDPIPYNGNMVLENGKYYSQDGVIYLCNRDTGNPVYNALSELIGHYVEVYTA